MNRPLQDEYPDYYNLYLNEVKQGDIIEMLEEQSAETQKLLASISEESGDKAYAFGKWTIKELIGHLIDTERILSYRALRFTRKDKQNLAGYDQDEYVKYGNFFKRTVKDLADELLFLRAANLKLFKNFSQEDLLEKGKANDFVFSVRAILYILLGHEIYHINFLKENYLNL